MANDRFICINCQESYLSIDLIQKISIIYIRHSVRTIQRGRAMQTFNELRDREEDRISLQFKVAMGIIGVIFAITLVYSVLSF